MARGYEEWQEILADLAPLYLNDLHQFRLRVKELTRESADDPAWLAFWKGYDFWQCQGDLERAKEKLRKALALQPDNPRFLLVLASILYENGEHSEVLPLTRDALDRDDGLSSGWNLLGLALTEQEDYDAATEAFHTAIRLDETSPYPWNGLGSLLRSRGEYDKAIQAHQKALAVNPRCIGALNSIGITLYLKGEFDNALAVYEEAFAKEPVLRHRLMILIGCCMVCIDKGDTDRTASFMNLFRRLGGDAPSWAGWRAHIARHMKERMNFRQRCAIAAKRLFSGFQACWK